MNSEVKYFTHNGPPIIPTLCHINPIRHIDGNFYKNHHNFGHKVLYDIIKI